MCSAWKEWRRSLRSFRAAETSGSDACRDGGVSMSIALSSAGGFLSVTSSVAGSTADVDGFCPGGSGGLNVPFG